MRWDDDMNTCYFATNLLLRPERIAKYCEESACLFVCLSVFLSVSLSACITSKPCGWNSPIFRACCPWPWLGLPLTALRYVVYFRSRMTSCFHTMDQWTESSSTWCLEEFARWQYQLNIWLQLQRLVEFVRMRHQAEVSYQQFPCLVSTGLVMYCSDW